MAESSARFPAKQSEQVFEYLFVISLEGIKKEVAEIKSIVFDLLDGTHPHYKSTPQITLFNIASDDRMSDILNMLQITWMPPFKIKLKGFDYYLHGQKDRTICLNIENKVSIVYLQKWLSEFFKLKKHSYDPQITIGRTLPEPAFEKVWNHIRSMSFEHELVCDRLLILKRKQQAGSPGQWKLFRKISLGKN